MKVRLSQAERRAKTRRRILTAAVKLFARKGYASTSTQEIAREVGMTTGALYWNFETKEDLLAAVLDHLFETTFAELLRPGDGILREDPVATFRTMIARVARVAAANHDAMVMIGVISAEASGTNRKVEKVLRQAYERLAQAVEPVFREANRIGAAHAPAIDDVECATQIFMGFYMGAVMHRQLFRSRLPIERALPIVERMLLAAALPAGSIRPK
jgi:AcrR family transcriptional regulator